MSVHSNLGSLDFSQPAIIEVDTSENQIKGIIIQYLNEVEVIIGNCCRSFSQTERDLSAFEREAVAISWVIEQFRDYIGQVPISIQCDFVALCTYINTH